MEDKVYESLAEALDRLPNGFPSTDGRVEIEILKMMFTPEEACIAATLSEEYEPAGVIAERLGQDVKDAKARLKSMSHDGRVLSKIDNRQRLFRLNPFIVGSYEAVMARLKDEDAHGFAHLIEDYWAASGGLAGIMTPRPAIHRVLPSQGALKSEWILPYDDVVALLSDARSFVLSDCVCRKQQDLIGDRKCSFPRRACLSFSHFKRPAHPDRVTRGEALAFLKEAEEIGLVHTVSNVAKGIYYVCNCCGCCCGILRSISDFGLVESVAHANYACSVTGGECTGCGICVARCQVRAISIVDSVAVVDKDRCIGCGLCVTTCATGAAHLELKPPSEIIDPPADPGEWARMRRASRGSG